MEWALHWIAEYGYFALYGLLVLGVVGLPVPDETLLMYTGYLVSRGTLSAPGAWAAAFLGSASGITISYSIGRTVGLYSIHRYGKYVHLTEDRIKRVHGWFERFGHWVFPLGYFIPGVRHATAIVAGTSELDARSFVMFAYAGAAVWVSTFLTLGYLLGEHWSEVLGVIHRYGVAAGLFLLIAGGFAWWLRWRRQRTYIHTDL